MKTALWESSPGALAAFLNSATQCYMADLYTFTLSGGAVIRYNSTESSVTVNGVTYPAGPAFKPAKSSVSVGVDVKTLDLTFAADSTVTINGVPLMAFVAAGGFDYCKVQRDRVFSAAPGAAWVGSINMFMGTESDTSVSRYTATMTVNSTTDLLNVNVPRNLYQPGCTNSLYDSACGISKAAYSFACTATTPTDAALLTFSTALAQAVSYFDQGMLVGTTGANAGIKRTIKSFQGGIFTVIFGWPSPVAVGDGFTAIAGCSKGLYLPTPPNPAGTPDPNGCFKFSNVIHFRGMPFVPAPETVI